MSGRGGTAAGLSRLRPPVAPGSARRRGSPPGLPPSAGTARGRLGRGGGRRAEELPGAEMAGREIRLGQGSSPGWCCTLAGAAALVVLPREKGPGESPGASRVGSAFPGSGAGVRSLSPLAGRG